MTRPDRPDFLALVESTRGLQPWRRVVHALTGVALAGLPSVPALGRDGALGVLLAGAAVLLVVDLLRHGVPAVNAWLFGALGALASPREARGIASSTWLVIGALLAYALLPLEAAVAAILVLALADPAASVVGRTWGRRPLGKGTVEGAATFFVVAFIVLVVVLRPGPWGAVLVAGVAVLATAVEVAPLGLDDNLTVPLATGAAIWLVLGAG